MFLVNRKFDSNFSASHPPSSLINRTLVGLISHREQKQSCGWYEAVDSEGRQFRGKKSTSLGDMPTPDIGEKVLRYVRRNGAGRKCLRYLRERIKVT